MPDPATAIDRAAVAFGMPMGPIELGRHRGLDICLSVADKMAGALHNPVPEKLRAGRPGHLGASPPGILRLERRQGGKTRTGGAAAGAGPGHQRSPDPASDQRVGGLPARRRVGDEDLLDAGVIFGTGFAPFRAAHALCTQSRQCRGETTARRTGGPFRPAFPCRSGLGGNRLSRGFGRARSCCTSGG